MRYLPSFSSRYNIRMLKKLSFPVLVFLSLNASVGVAEEDPFRKAIVDCCSKRGYATIVECDMDNAAKEACANEAGKVEIGVREVDSDEESKFRFGSPEVDKIIKRSEEGDKEAKN